MTPSQYPYQGRNLFDEPEFYNFAKCANADFIDGWMAYRDTTFAALDARGAISETGVLSDDTAAGVPAGARSLRSHLLEAMSHLDGSREGGLKASAALEPFIVKYEVHRRLFDSFLETLLRHPDAGLASMRDYTLFAYVMALIARELDSLKHLSTLMKICDALVSAPLDSFADQDVALLRETLLIERALVEELDRTYAVG